MKIRLISTQWKVRFKQVLKLKSYIKLFVNFLEQMEVPEDLEGEADKEKSVEDDQKNNPDSSDDEQAPDEDGAEKFDENPNEETQPEPEGGNTP